MDYVPLTNFIDKKCNVAIETGCYLGETTEILSTYNNFFQVHSIELSQKLATKAKIKFLDKPWVKIWGGDSGEKLPLIFEHIKNTFSIEPKCWVLLDAHFSGGETVSLEETASPLLQELYILKQYKDMVKTIIIDDIAVCYDLLKSSERSIYTRGWPTITEVMQVLTEINEKFKIMHNASDRPNGLLIANLY